MIFTIPSRLTRLWAPGAWLLTITLLAVVCPVLVRAQSDYVPGYYVGRDGVRAEVLIEDFDAVSSPRRIAVKRGGSAATTYLEVADLDTIALPGRWRYVRAVVPVDRWASRGKTAAGKAPDYESEEVLIRQHLAGDFPLYEYRDGPVTQFYLGSADTLMPLVYKRYRYDASNEAENTAFRGQLFNALKCETPGASDFEYLRYRVPDIKRVVIAGAECRGARVASVSTEEGRAAPVRYTAWAGVARLNLGADVALVRICEAAVCAGLPIRTAYDPSLENRLAYRVGGEVELMIARRSERLAAYFVAEYFDFRTATQVTNARGDSAPFSDIEIVGLHLHPGLKYYPLGPGKLRPYVQAGVAVSSLMRVDFRNYVAPITSRFSPGAIMGAGVAYGPISARVLYRMSTRLLPADTFELEMSYVAVSLGYSFGGQ